MLTPAERDALRSRRKRVVRGRTLSLRRMTKRELELGRRLFPDQGESEGRPRTRAECGGGERPCPYVSCAHHLYLDVSRTGAIKLNFPDLEVWEMKESCALDVADRGGERLEGVGEVLNLTRERIRQIENAALEKLRDRGHLRELAGAELARPLEEAPDDRPELAEARALEDVFDLETFLTLDDLTGGPEAA